MNKISKKLFCYFLIVVTIFSLLVLVGFYWILKYQMIQHHEAELRNKVYSVKEQLEDSFDDAGRQKLCVCLKYLDDITMAEVYVVREDGKPFICEMCGECEKNVTNAVAQFGTGVITAGKYVQEETKNEESTSTICAGVPVKEKDEITSAVVIVENVKFQKENLLIPIMVLAGCLAVAIIAAALMAVFLVKRFMKPIHRIAYVTKELADGNYNIKTGVSDDNEIGILAQETDILACRLDYANKESDRLQQMQKDYVSNISHELRTPVAVIRSSLEAIQDGIVPMKNMQEYYDQILAETISLQRLINDMLELSRLENEGFLIEKEMIDLKQVLDDSVRGVRLLARERRITIMYQNDEKEWLIEGDYGRVRQMFIIALENAVKYSEDNSIVRIEMSDKKKDYYISVVDEGCGMSQEQQKHAFEKFYRASSGQSGTGLGLVILKNIAMRHNINVHLYSILNEGTKLTYIIPKNDTEMSHD